ncbi:MarR family transcriptional regulator [uncultured Psychrobacter sp.]|uniref:MarR family winged helix-turn-helix transcriptional regulator n=1 Tax=uncultured Psychrobacter sp. TaxID=259303 RepID=UPI00262A4995|nr:MarR family transcriptional regulator [uncultured Psychrobacter sp.]
MQTEKSPYLPNSKKFNYRQYPFYWVARVESLYNQEMEKTLKPVGMDSSRWRVGLLLREHETLAISEISNEALMKIPTTTKIVQRMEKEGLVKVFKQESDGRVRLVRLTEQGKSQVEMIVKKTAPMFENLFSKFSAEELETFLRLSEKLFDNLESNES